MTKLRWVMVASAVAVVVGVLVTWATMSCACEHESSSSMAESTLPSEDALVIKLNTQATTGDLKIGAGNFRMVDGEAEAKLWFYVRNRPEDDRSPKVHVGDVLDVAGRIFLVHDVTAEAVTLEEQTTE